MLQGCGINWNKGKNLTVKTIKKKQKHKARGAVRTITKQVPADSFFNFFAPPIVEDEEKVDIETQNVSVNQKFRFQSDTMRDISFLFCRFYKMTTKSVISFVRELFQRHCCIILATLWMMKTKTLMWVFIFKCKSTFLLFHPILSLKLCKEKSVNSSIIANFCE